MRLVILAAMLAIGMTAQAEWTEQDAVCDWVDEFNPNYVIKPVFVEMVFRKNKNCDSYRCYYEQAPNDKRRISVYVNKWAKPRATWGTAGWDKSVVVVRNLGQLEAGYFLAMGVELSSLTTNYEEIPGDLNYHYAFIEEMWCLAANGNPQVGLGESSRIPRNFDFEAVFGLQ